MEIFIDTFML